MQYLKHYPLGLQVSEMRRLIADLPDDAVIVILKDERPNLTLQAGPMPVMISGGRFPALALSTTTPNNTDD